MPILAEDGNRGQEIVHLAALFLRLLDLLDIQDNNILLLSLHFLNKRQPSCHCEAGGRSNLLSAATEIASSHTTLLAMT